MAMDQGLTPATVLNDVQQGFQAAQGQYLPRNFDEKEHGPVLARVALANSYNLAAVDLASRLGAPFLLDALRLTGFRLPGETPERLGLGVILGGVDVRLWEVVRAYTALARGGVMLEPSLVEGTPSKGVRVLSSEAAYLVGDILSDDVARSPAFGRQSALSLPFKASVKTGTSKDFRDNWTVGYSTRFLVGVWVGDFSGASMRGVSGITGAGALWHQVMRMAHAGVEVAAPVRPVGVVEQEICAVSGMVPGLHCGSRVVELFKRGSAPRAACTYHPQAGRTVVPEEFEGWTRRVGLPGGVAAAAVRVVFPSHGAEFALDRDRPQEGHGMTLRVTGRGEGHVALELNGVVLRTGKGAVSVVWTATPGRHVVEAVGEDGTRDRAEFLVR
jgi:penicillin-binding protein 1C